MPNTMAMSRNPATQEKGDHEGDPRADDDSTEYVPPKLVGAHEVRKAGSHQGLAQILFAVLEGRYKVREYSRQQQDCHDHESGCGKRLRPETVV